MNNVTRCPFKGTSILDVMMSKTEREAICEYAAPTNTGGGKKKKGQKMIPTAYRDIGENTSLQTMWPLLSTNNQNPEGAFGLNITAKIMGIF